jgi:hypothetical protein
MVVVPGATPVTTPDVFTVALVISLLLQVPPVDVVAKVIVAPTHTDDGPVTGAGCGQMLTPASGDVKVVVPGKQCATINVSLNR